jgi:hypothetical protein
MPKYCLDNAAITFLQIIFYPIQPTLRNVALKALLNSQQTITRLPFAVDKAASV